jgi:hypothetical protein
MGPILATAAVRAFSSPIYFCFHFRGPILKREILISYKVIKPRGMSTKPVIVVAEFFGLYLHARTCLKNAKKIFFILNLFYQKHHARGPVIRTQKKN